MIDKVKLAVADYLQDHPNKTAKDVSIACFGLAFKPDIDDLRESPALSITYRLGTTHTGTVIAVEPHIEELPASLADLVKLKTIDEAVEQADIFVLLVDHKEFKETCICLTTNKIVIDTRGIWVEASKAL